MIFRAAPPTLYAIIAFLFVLPVVQVAGEVDYSTLTDEKISAFCAKQCNAQNRKMRTMDDKYLADPVKNLAACINKCVAFFEAKREEKKAEKAAAATTDGKDEHPPPDPVGDDHDIISCAHILCNMKSQGSSNIQELQEAQQQKKRGGGGEKTGHRKRPKQMRR